MKKELSWTPLLLISVFYVRLYPTTSAAIPKEANPKIAVLGAGMAGITVAKRLQELGYSNIVILEGGNRVGGRMKDVHVGNSILQEGANWIQSLGANPVLKLAKQYGLKYATTDYEDFKTFDKNGNNITVESKYVDDKFDIVYRQVENLAKQMTTKNETDATYRAGTIRKEWFPRTALDDVIEYYYHDFEMGYTPEGSSLKESLIKTYDIHGSEDDANVIDERGYAHIPKSMLNEIMAKGGVNFYLNKLVTEIRQNERTVIIQTNENEEFSADYVIVTFSIGVLQSGLVKFRPQLPEWKLDAIDQIQMTVYYNLFFKFPYKFWDDNQFFLYTSERRGYYPIFQNFNKLVPNSNILHVTVTGEEARRVHRIPREQVKSEVMEILNKIYLKRNYNKRIPQPLDYSIPQWYADPLFMGCFSNMPPGYTPQRQMNLSVPLGRIYFAGEANSLDHSGYVHGAWYSGMETAEMLHSFICKKIS